MHDSTVDDEECAVIVVSFIYNGGVPRHFDSFRVMSCRWTLGPRAYGLPVESIPFMMVLIATPHT